MGHSTGRYTLALQLLACVLTLAASGDDINLMRVALPAPFSQIPIGAIPLDDENTDFVRAEDGVSSLDQQSQRDGRLASAAGWDLGAAGCLPVVPLPRLGATSRERSQP